MRNNFQIFTEDLLKQYNANIYPLENTSEKNEKLGDKALIHEGDELSKQKSLKTEDDSARPVQTVLKRKKNREIKISLDFNKDRKKDSEENDINM